MAGVQQCSEAELKLYRNQILETFKRYDRNNDGNISRDEMWALLRVLDKSGCLQHDGVDAMLTALDKNDDGLVDIEEFIDWVLAGNAALDAIIHSESEVNLDNISVYHIFVAPQDEANLERCTLFELRRDDNSRILADAGMGALENPARLVVSVGSSSTQAYDSEGLSISVPVGTKVRSAESYKELTRVLIERAKVRPYEKVVLVNSIGYQLTVSDPRLVPLGELAKRAAANEKGTLPSTVDMHRAIADALPHADMHVFNRSKDPETKRYKYPQLSNDFTEALVSSRGMSLMKCQMENKADAVVDWGGGSFKVYVNGKRLATEIMDANAVLCEGGFLNRQRVVEAIHDIKKFVLCPTLVPTARHIFIAQTGKARELALREGLTSAL